MRVVVVGAFLLTLALSGCVGGDGLESDPGADGAGGATPTGETGSVEGQVRQDSLEVVPEAAVVLTDGQEAIAEAQTDADGRFVLNAVPPGSYRILITAPCCETFVRELAVRAGEITPINAVLVFVPSNSPAVERGTWEGFIGCAVHVWGAGGNNTLCDDVDSNTDREHIFRVGEGIRSLVFAMDWDPELTTISFLSVQDNNTVPAMMLRTYYGDEWVPNRTYLELDGPPPLEGIIRSGDGNAEWDFPNITAEAPLGFQVWSSEGWGGFSYQQRFTVHYDIYYWEEAPEGARALPDA